MLLKKQNPPLKSCPAWCPGGLMRANDGPYSLGDKSLDCYCHVVEEAEPAVEIVSRMVPRGSDESE